MFILGLICGYMLWLIIDKYFPSKCCRCHRILNTQQYIEFQNIIRKEIEEEIYDKKRL